MKRGLLELADGGTLFLDEIGDLSPTLQPKLLRVLETQHFRRVGGSRKFGSMSASSPPPIATWPRW